MDFLQTFGMRILDILFILMFFSFILINLPIKRLGGAVKGIISVAVLWFIANALNFHMASAVLGNITQYGFLLLIIMFPNEFRKLMENIGRRRVFSWNTRRLIEHDSRKELAKAVVNLAMNKQGATIVIAREDNLDEEILSGEELGDVYITQNMIETQFSPRSKTKNGALIIRDDMIVSAGCRLPVAKNESLESTGAGLRHLSGLGVVSKYDCMSIVVSEESGTISLFGKLGNKTKVDYALRLLEYDLQDGIDENYIVNRIEDFLRGKEIDVKEIETNKRKGEKKRIQKTKTKK